MFECWQEGEEIKQEVGSYPRVKTVSCGEGQQGAMPDIGYLTHTALLCLYLKRWTDSVGRILMHSTMTL